MSLVKVQGNASGTGIFTIASPNGNTDRTLTLPDNTGTLLTSTGAISVNASAPVPSVSVDASGNVGIGTSSPGAKFVLNGGAQFQGAAGFPTTGTGIEVVGNVNGASNYIQAYNRTASTWQDLVINGNVVAFGTAGAERVRIDTSGNLLVATTSAISQSATSGRGYMVTGSGAAVVQNMDSTPEGISYNYTTFTSGTAYPVVFRTAGAVRGFISTNGSTVAYTSISDYRLKEAVQPMQNALACVAQLRPVTYKWKADGTDGQGFIAHELQAVVPDAVTGEKDAVDAEGNPRYQGIDTSFLVATLTAAIQELKAIVDAQGAEIAALKGQA